MTLTLGFYTTCFTIVMLVIMFVYIMLAENKRSIHYVFIMAVVEVFVWAGAVIARTLSGDNQDMVILWENVTYIGIAMAPVSLIMLARAYSGKELNKKYLLLCIVPLITQVMAWTNDFHHLFYQYYGQVGEPNTFGYYFYFHAAYSYFCMGVGFFYLCYIAIKNRGLFSIQALLIIAGSIIPLSLNICYTLGIPSFSVYSTPVGFTFMLLLYLFAMFRFNLLKVSPIALQTVINRISDGFIVVDMGMNIIEFNKTYVDNFHYFSGLQRGENFYTMLNDADRSNLSAEQFRELIISAAEAGSTLVKDIEVETGESKQYYTVEFTPIIQWDRCTAVILLFKNITQHIKDMIKIQDNQAILLERERLASLGQLIGGIAHNLKTPIMSVSGGIDQVEWLVQEYAASVGDPEVTVDDHAEIAGEMQKWLGRMKMHMGYMSDIISTVKDQATTFANTDLTWFTLDEMLKRVKILMQHEIVKNKCHYIEDIQADTGVRIGGDVNSMVQILDNIIVNAIQSYEGKGGDIVLKIVSEGNTLLMTICDFGKGIDDKVKDRLFKEMVTTKGKYGTGLGLYMSYSTIKGMFRGNMWFESSPGQGTKFYIQLPLLPTEQTAEGDQIA
jgi:two-component system sensor histidine kinase HupT/HoxJ